MTPAERAHLLASFGIDEHALIGEGLESRVYALSGDLVLRLARGRAGHSPDPRRLKAFLDGIAGEPLKNAMTFQIKDETKRKAAVDGLKTIATCQ